jgi:hypothetical protein
VLWESCLIALSLGDFFASSVVIGLTLTPLAVSCFYCLYLFYAVYTPHMLHIYTVNRTARTRLWST